MFRFRPYSSLPIVTLDKLPSRNVMRAHDKSMCERGRRVDNARVHDRIYDGFSLHLVQICLHQDGTRQGEARQGEARIANQEARSARGSLARQEARSPRVGPLSKISLSTGFRSPRNFPRGSLTTRFALRKTGSEALHKTYPLQGFPKGWLSAVCYLQHGLHSLASQGSNGPSSLYTACPCSLVST